MEQYIPKSALVAEIKSKIKKYTKRGEESDTKRDGCGMYWGGVISCLNEVLTLCDTLEVKEVDLKKALESWRHNHFHGRRDKDASGEYLERDSQLDLAKHFFELGLKSKSSYVGIPNIDDTLKEMGVDPDSKSAESFKEFYYMALEKFKAQKWEEI